MGEAAPEAAVVADELGGITADMLRTTFDHWRIFEKDGRWLAMREGTASTEGPRALIHPLVCAMTPFGLAEQLSLQEWLRRMTAEELAAVWRDGFTRPGPENGAGQ